MDVSSVDPGKQRSVQWSTGNGFALPCALRSIKGMTAVRLSSGTTFYHKFLAPVIVLIFTKVPLIEFFNPDSPFPITVKFLFVAALLGVFGYALRWGHSLKSVALVGKELRVSNFLVSEMVPSSNVESVKFWRSGFVELIEMYFSTGTRFGKSIRFMSVIRWPLNTEHPLVCLLHLESAGSNATRRASPESEESQ